MPVITLEPTGGFTRVPHRSNAGEQDTLPSRYGWQVPCLYPFYEPYVGSLLRIKGALSEARRKQGASEASAKAGR